MQEFDLRESDPGWIASGYVNSKVPGTYDYMQAPGESKEEATNELIAMIKERVSWNPAWKEWLERHGMGD